MNPPRESSRNILLQPAAGVSHTALFLVSFLWLLVSPTAYAIVDTNDNGLSDLWERHFNDGNLFPSSFDPQADPDGDGWTNEIEATAGTDPHDANSPNGYVRPTITHIPAVYTTGANGHLEIATPEAVTITWPTLTGKRYTLLSSTDLTAGSWIPIGDPEPGTGGEIGAGIEITQAGGGAPPRLFLRVAISDYDTDRDGLSDHEEYLLGTSVSNPDSDGDGDSDSEEAGKGTNSNNRDSDGDGLDDADDADPLEALIDWPAVPESSFALIEIDSLPNAEYPRDINDRGEVLFTNSIWSGGNLDDLPDVEESGDYSSQDWDVEEMEREEYSYFVHTTHWTHFGPDGKVIGRPQMAVNHGPGDLEVNIAALILPDSPPINSIQALGLLTDSSLVSVTPFGMDGQSRIFASVFTYTDSISGLWILNGSLQKSGELTLPSGFHVVSGTVSANGWVGANLSNEDRTSHKLAVWNPQGILQPAPSGHDGKYNDVNLTPVFSDWNIISNTRFPGGESEVLIPSTAGGLTIIPSLNDKKITTFAGDGTAITSDEKLWRNGKLTALREISTRYGELSDEGYSFYPAKATKHGSYLLNAEDSSGNPKAFVALPMQIVSRDKFLAGSFRIPESYADLEIEFAGHENLGRYGDLLGDGSTKIFNSVEELLTSSPTAQPADQKVWFVKDPVDAQKIRFYTCYTMIGKVEIKLHLNNGGSAQPSLVTHQLKAAPDFAKVISYVDRWVKGSSFAGSEAATTWLTMNSTSIAGELANQTRACLIPFFDIIDQIQGFTPLVMGLCDGVRKGWEDDMQFLAAITNGTVNAGGWVVSHAAGEINGWSNDPDKRVEELKKILHDLCTKTVLPGLSALGENFTTWEGFREKAWRAWDKAWKNAPKLDLELKVITLNAALFVIDSLKAWGNDFCDRMMTGEEKSAWYATQWDTGPLLSEVLLFRNQAYYTFGYTFGYLGEQCVTAAVSAGSVTAAKIIAKSGVSMINKLGPRALGAVAVRLNYLKEALANGPLLDDGLRLAYEGMMSSAAKQPISPLIKEVPLTMMENRMAGQTFARATFNFKEWIATAVKNSNVRKLVTKSGSEAILSKRTAQLMHLMGDECDEVTMKNFMKVAEERLIIAHPDGTVDEYFEGFFRAFEGNSSLANNLEDPAHSIASLSSGAKARLKAFLSDPDPGYLWKIDDPVFVDGVPQIPQNYFARGVLGELDVFSRIYRKQGYTHAPSAEGYDILGPKWVQVKTTANPSSSGNIQAMQKAIDKLILESPPAASLKLHILKKPGTNSAMLDEALEAYKQLNPEIRNRVEILIESYNIGPQ